MLRDKLFAMAPALSDSLMGDWVVFKDILTDRIPF
jgi:hypothetical protein